MGTDIKYARSGDVHIAYRIFGDGPRDLVLIPGTLSHADLYWEFPSNQYLLKRLTSFARVIVFDKRGQGLSDRVAEQTLEERIGDVRVVMDAAGSDRATIYGWSEAGSMSVMFSASYPERTSALVLCGSYACIKAESWAIDEQRWNAFFSMWRPTGVRVSSCRSTPRAVATTRPSFNGSAGWSGPRRARAPSWR
jgi:pimeloyl-ACP methyl ester carboxylesterase